MRSILCLAILALSTTSAAASPADLDHGERSEDTAFKLSLGAELGSLALLSAPVLHAALTDCNVYEPGSGGEVVVDTRTDGMCSRGVSNTFMLAGIAGAAGTLIAPGLGHWWGANRPVTRGLALRLGGLAVATLGSMALACWDESCSTRPDRFPGVLVPISGVALYVAGTIDDIATVRGAVRARNAQLRSVTVVPAPMANGGGGLVVAGRF